MALQVGLGAGTVFGVYIAQNYQVNLSLSPRPPSQSSPTLSVQVPNVVEMLRRASDVAASYQTKPPPTTPDKPSPPSSDSDGDSSNRESPRNK